MQPPPSSPPGYHALLDYQAPEDLLADRVILVTGAAQGIGRAAALRYARHGATLVLLDWDRKGLESLNDEIVAQGRGEALLCPADLSGITIVGLREIADHIGQRLGRLDGLLNNAAWIGALAPFEHYPPTTWAKVMNINLAAPFFLTQWCMPLLHKAGDPVVGFSLQEASRAYWGGFALAKAAQEALIGVLADEYHAHSAHPVRLFGIDTGPVMTPGRRLHYPGETIDAHPRPEHVTGPYLYAMGPEARGHSPLLLRAAPGRDALQAPAGPGNAGA
jgi:NAD(P)-dependent dehydrogenase (short-subunit alcohol dehydrogenase family)